MYNITLISTRHENLGICNSDKLFKIIELINPDVIFEEMPPSYYEIYYVYKTKINLESEAIRKYSEGSNKKNIQVDYDNVPPDSFFESYGRLISRIEGLADINGYTFRESTDTNKFNTTIHGFQYLNSIDCIKINETIRKSIENGLQVLNNENLFEIYNEWKNVHNRRENVMLHNIYNYSKTHRYNRAIFTLGAGHRKSIIEKIKEYEKTEEFKLNWSFYSE